MSGNSIMEEDITLLELLDRLLDKGIVIAGDLIISVANIDLLYVGLRLVLGSVETITKSMRGEENNG